MFFCLMSAIQNFLRIIMFFNLDLRSYEESLSLFTSQVTMYVVLIMITINKLNSKKEKFQISMY